MHSAESTVESRQSIARRASELFAQYRDDIHGRTDRLFAGLMAFQWLLGDHLRAVGVAARVGGLRQSHEPACVGRGRRGRRDQSVPCAARSVPAGADIDALRDRRRADADGRASHPPDRRADRDALSRVRLARLPRLLSRLAGTDSGHDRRRARSPAAWDLLAAVGLWRGGRESVAVAGARRVGHLRGRLPRRRLPSQPVGDAPDGRANRGARAGDSHPARGRARAAAGARRRAPERRAGRHAGRAVATSRSARRRRRPAPRASSWPA